MGTFKNHRLPPRLDDRLDPGVPIRDGAALRRLTMRFLFKTDYAQDVRLAKHGGHRFWYSALLVVLVAAPWIFDEYWLAQLTFVLIYAVVELGLMLLAGFTGQFSLGHPAYSWASGRMRRRHSPRPACRSSRPCWPPPCWPAWWA